MSRTNAIDTLKSSFLLILEAFAKKLVGLVSTLILARILTPEDYGIVAMATLSFGLLEILAQSGDHQYIMSLKEVKPGVLDTAFTINLILKTFVAIALFLSAGMISAFFDELRLVSVLQAFSLIFLFTAFSNPQILLLKKNQQYKDIVLMILVCKVVSSGIAIAVAVVYKSYWALIAGQFFAYVLPVIGGYIISPVFPKFSLTNAKQQLVFTTTVILENAFGYFRNQLDMILVGKYLGSVSTGSYHVMKYLSYLPSSHLIVPVSEPLHAKTAELDLNDVSNIHKVNASLLLLVLIASCITSVLFFQSEHVVSILLGQKWVEYSDLLAVFSLLLVPKVFVISAKKNLFVKFMTKFVLYIELVSLVFLVIAFYLLKPGYPSAFVTIKVFIDSIISVFTFLVVQRIMFGDYRYLSTIFQVVIAWGLPLLFGYAISRCLVISSPFIGLLCFCVSGTIGLIISALSFSRLGGTYETNYLLQMFLKVFQKKLKYNKLKPK